MNARAYLAETLRLFSGRPSPEDGILAIKDNL